MLTFMKQHGSIAWFIGARDTSPQDTRVCNLLCKVQQPWLFRQSLFFALLPVFFLQRIGRLKEEQKTGKRPPFPPN